MPARFTTAFRNAVLNGGVNAALGTSATLQIRTGPPGSTIGSNTGTVLATFTLASTPFQPAAAGSVTNTAVSPVNGSATGSAGCAHLLDSTSTVVADYDEADASLDVVPNSIVSGAPVNLNFITLSIT